MTTPPCTCGKSEHHITCPAHPAAQALVDACRGVGQADALGLEPSTASALIQNRLGEYLVAARVLPTEEAFQEALQVVRAGLEHGAEGWSNASSEKPEVARARFEEALQVLLSRCGGRAK
jgi:hypothetical protein